MYVYIYIYIYTAMLTHILLSLLLGSYLAESCEVGDGQIVFGTSGQTRNPSDCRSPFYWKPFQADNVPVQYDNWHTGEPNCGEKGQNCITYLYSNSTVIPNQLKWDDHGCTRPRAFCMLCEYELS